jgi:hypothetical protein
VVSTSTGTPVAIPHDYATPCVESGVGTARFAVPVEALPNQAPLANVRANTINTVNGRAAFPCARQQCCNGTFGGGSALVLGGHAGRTATSWSPMLQGAGGGRRVQCAELAQLGTWRMAAARIGADLCRRAPPIDQYNDEEAATTAAAPCACWRRGWPSPKPTPTTSSSPPSKARCRRTHG